MNKNVMTGTYIDYANDNKLVNFNFYTNLYAYEKIKFVNTVTDTLISNNYNHIIKDMIFDFTIISVFTNVDISEIVEATDSLFRIENLLEETNIVDIVKANVDEGLIEELNKAVNMNIEYRTGIKLNNINDSLSHLIKTIEKKIENIDTSAMMEIAEKLNGVAGELTPEGIVKAYLKNK